MVCKASSATHGQGKAESTIDADLTHYAADDFDEFRISLKHAFSFGGKS